MAANVQKSLSESSRSGHTTRSVKSDFQIRFTAGALFLLTVAAITLAWINFQKEREFQVPYDGVRWLERDGGLTAERVEADGPAAKAGIIRGDRLTAVNDHEVKNTAGLIRQLYRAGAWTKATYTLVRGSVQLDSSVILVPADKSLFSWLRFIALIYLGIGLYVLLRRWTAPGSTHFYIFCLVSFIAYSFKYTGKLNQFDWTIYWGNITAGTLAAGAVPALCADLPREAPFCPQARIGASSDLSAGAGVAGDPNRRHALPASQRAAGLESGPAADRIFRAVLCGRRRGALVQLPARQFADSAPAAEVGDPRHHPRHHAVHDVLCDPLPDWRTADGGNEDLGAVVALLPLTFGYAIFRYRLMDVDLIFKRGMVYTVSAAAIVGFYFAIVAGVAELVHTQVPSSGPVGLVIAIVATALLFDPLRKWIQERIDQFFYRTRYDYRRTLIEFGRELSAETDLDKMLISVENRLSRTLLVDRMAIFLSSGEVGQKFLLAKSFGINQTSGLDLSF